MAASRTASWSSRARRLLRRRWLRRPEVRVEELQDPLVDFAARLLVIDAVSFASQRQPLDFLVVLLQRRLHAPRMLVVGACVRFAVDQQYRRLDVLGVVDRRLRA